MSAYIISAATTVVAYMIAALGLDMQFGWGGLPNLSYFMVFAVSGYFSAVLTMGKAAPYLGETYIIGVHLPWLVGLIAATASGAVLGWLTGFVSLRRLRADYFAIVTLCAYTGVYTLIVQQDGIVNGATGLFNIPQPTSSPLAFLLICLGFLALATIVRGFLFKSPYGRVLRAVREDPVSAAAFGKDPYSVQMRVMVIGSVFASLAGALFVTYLTAFNPSAWTAGETLVLLIGIIIGGRSNTLGVLVGIVLVVGFLDQGTSYFPEIPGHPGLIAAIRQIVIGALVIVVLRFRPEGILRERILRSELRAPQVARWWRLRSTERMSPASEK